MDRVLDDVVSKIVGFTIDGTAFDTRAGYPLCVAFWVVVSAVVRFGKCALAVKGSAKLATPNNEGVI